MRYARYIASCLALLAVIGSSSTGWTQSPRGSVDQARLAGALNHPDWHVDDHKRVYRVAFPLHDRFVFDYGAGFEGRANSRVHGQRVHAGWKTTMGLDFAEENIWWRLRHTLFDTEYTAGSASSTLRPTAVRADYLRHDDSSFVVVPMERDLKIPAPFDIGVTYQIGSFDLRRRAADWSLRGVDVAEVAVPLDFIRDPEYRHRLAVGPAGRYRLDTSGRPLVHHLAPMTGAEALYAWESADGLYSIDLRARCVSSMRTGEHIEVGWRARCDGRGRMEAIVLSINDQPVSIPLEFEVAQEPADGSEVTWRTWIGVRLSLSQTL